MKNLILASLVFVASSVAAQNIFPLVAVDFHSKNEISTGGIKVGFTDGKHAGGYTFYKRASYQLDNGGVFDIDFKQNTYGVGAIVHIREITLNVGAGVAQSEIKTKTIYGKNEFTKESDSMYEVGLNYNVTDKFMVGCSYVNTTNGFHVTLTHIFK